jgi:hypothetical protein
MKRLLILFLLVPEIALGTDPTLLKKGEAAPYEGLLFSPTKAASIKQNLELLDITKQLNTSYQNEIKLLKSNSTDDSQKLQLLSDQNDKLAKSANEDKSMNNWERFGYFIGGALVMGIAVRLGMQVGK